MSALIFEAVYQNYDRLSILKQHMFMVSRLLSVKVLPWLTLNAASAPLRAHQLPSVWAAGCSPLEAGVLGQICPSAQIVNQMQLCISVGRRVGFSPWLLAGGCSHHLGVSGSPVWFHDMAELSFD